MTTEEKVKKYNGGISEVYGRLPTGTMAKIVEVLLEAYEKGRKVITMGNGGHAGTASHFINDLLKHTVVSDKKDEVIVKGKRFKALCLVDNMPTVTSWANDVGWDDVFSQQLANWVEEGDVVIGITGSGNSENVLRAFKLAKEHKALTIAFTGYEGGKAKDIADISFIVPSDNISFIEDVHFSLTHICCDIIRKLLQEKHA